MTDQEITTGVDDLLDLLRSVSKISLSDAAKRLGVSITLVQAWVDFLVEEEVVGIEYSFTKPIIYLNKPAQESVIRVKEDDAENLAGYKNQFVMHAMQQHIPAQQVGFFWKNHIQEMVKAKKDFFQREAKKRGLTGIEDLWIEYVEKLMSA